MLSSKISTLILFAWPATASSIELSIISEKRWCIPFLSVPPIYIPGLFLTGSSPSRTSISDASYETFFDKFNPKNGSINFNHYTIRINNKKIAFNEGYFSKQSF